MLGHRWRSVQAAWPNGLRHSPCRCHACPKWHHLSANHYQGSRQHHTSRQYNRQRSSPGGELRPTPPQIKPPLQAAQVHRTAEDLQIEGGEMVADLSVTQEACRKRQVCSRHVRRAICPLGQCQVFHHQRHLKGHSLSGEVGLRPPTAIPLDWWQNFAALGGRKTLSVCSGSTTSLTLPTLGRQIGYDSGTPSSHTSSSTRRRH